MFDGSEAGSVSVIDVAGDDGRVGAEVDIAELLESAELAEEFASAEFATELSAGMTALSDGATEFTAGSALSAVVASLTEPL